MGIQINSSSGGSVSLDPVSSLASDITLTLPDSVGSAGQYLRNSATPGTLEFASVSASTGNDYNLASGTLSGTSVTVTGIPSNALKVVVNFSGVDWTASNSLFYIQLGTSSGIVSSGYKTRNGYFGGAGAATSDTIFFRLNHFQTGTSFFGNGTIEFNKISDNVWIGNGLLFYEAVSNLITGSAGIVDLGGTLDRISLGMYTNSFAAGTYNVNVFTE